MNTFRDVLLRRIRKLDELILAKTEAVSAAPEGHLRILKKSGFVQYYDGNEYLHTDDSRIRLLAQRRYDKQVIKAALAEKRLLMHVVDNYPHIPIEEIYMAQNAVRQELIKPIMLPDEEFIERWLAEPYIRKPFAKNAPEIYSNKGERVRSKSEKMLADMFFLHGQPYKLECPLSNMYGEVIHPDFTLLRVKSRTIFYWEHCGMLDNPSYASDLDNRLRFYGSLGIFPGKGLLLTTETDGRPIDMRLAEEMMRQVLL